MLCQKALRLTLDTEVTRDVAVRRRKVEFLGLGHPLVDALIAYVRFCEEKISHFHRWFASRYLSCQLVLTRFTEELLKFKREVGQCFSEQHGFT